MISIRHENPEDYEAVYRINELAFEQTGEADLVEKLRAAEPYISLVAIKDDKIVGHIFFSQVTLEDKEINALGLAPMAVLPEFQKQGVGSELVKRGLQECKTQGFETVVVLGHPEYYPRFGFVPAKTRGVWCEYPVPDEVFMVLELKTGALEKHSGVFKYRPEFAEV